MVFPWEWHAEMSIDIFSLRASPNSIEQVVSLGHLTIKKIISLPPKSENKTVNFVSLVRTRGTNCERDIKQNREVLNLESPKNVKPGMNSHPSISSYYYLQRKETLLKQASFFVVRSSTPILAILDFALFPFVVAEVPWGHTRPTATAMPLKQ